MKGQPPRRVRAMKAPGISIRLHREVLKTVAGAIRFKMKKREADQRRTPWNPDKGFRDLTAEELDRLTVALEVIEEALGIV